MLRMTPLRLLITAAILIAATGASHAQIQQRSKLLRIGLPFPYPMEYAGPDEEPLAFDKLTDLTLGTYSEVAKGDWKVRGEPLYHTHQRVFPAFSAARELDDGKKFFAELKPNILFHDGSTATVDDVEFSLKRHPDRYPAIGRIKFTKLSSNSFTLSSDRPEYWLKILDTPLKKRMGAGEKSISAGPYIIASVDRQKKKVRLKAFKQYVNGPPLAPEMEYTFYANPEMAMFGFLEDETDFMCGLSPGQERALGSLIGKIVVRYTSNFSYILAFNAAKPPMDNILVRQAISSLIDRPGLVSKSDALKGEAIPTQYQFVMSPPVTKAYAEPPKEEEAFMRLKKAGYVLTPRGWEKGGKPIKLLMQVPSTLSSCIPEARIIARWLREAGVDTSIEIVDMDTSYRANIKKSHMVFSWVFDKLEFQKNYTYFEPGGAENLFQSTDPAPAALLAGVKSDSLTPSSKEEIIRQIGSYSYSAPLYYPIEYCAGRGNTGYENIFFRSPFLFSVINRNAPSDQLKNQMGTEAKGR